MKLRQLTSIAELNQADHESRQRTFQRLFVVVGSFIIWLIFGLTAASWLDSWFNGLLTLNLSVAIIAIGVFAVLFAVPTWIDRPHREYPQLFCPACGKDLRNLRHTVIASGNCPHCGRRVIKDEKHGT